MKLSFVALVNLLLITSPSHGLLVGPVPSSRRSSQRSIATRIIGERRVQGPVLHMSDFDFPSAMPDKPQLTEEQQMEASADNFIEVMTNSLGEGVAAPLELEQLKEARKAGASMKDLASKIYILMIERGMLYDEEPETGTLTPTEFDIKNNLDIKEVKDEFFYLYSYGMKLMDRGMVTGDELKDIVLERLIKRTGLEPEAFDKWLGF